MSDLIERSVAYAAIGFERCNKDCASCPTKCTWFYTINNIPTVNQWISCNDRLPDKTGYYLVCDSTAEFDNIRGRQDVSKFVIGRHGGHWYGAIRRESITHWMPLPEPPERDV